jgi:hypothetical protein
MWHVSSEAVKQSVFRWFMISIRRESVDAADAPTHDQYRTPPHSHTTIGAFTGPADRSISA